MSPASTPKRRRPALWAALSFAAGLVLADRVCLPLIPLSIAGAALWAASLVLWLASPRLAAARVVAFLGLGAVLGAVRYQVATQLSPPNHILRLDLFEREGLFRGRVAAEPERNQEQTRFPLELEEVETDSARFRVSGRVLVSARAMAVPADYGDRVVLRSRLHRPQPARNPGGFDHRRFLAQEQIHGLLYLSKPEQFVAFRADHGHWLYEYLVLPVQRSVSHSLSRNLGSAPGGLILGVLLGEKRALPEDLQQSFRLTGLTHALVVSGMNVGLVVLFFSTVFRLCRLPPRLEIGLDLLAVAVFALVTGLQPPVLRASLMAAVLLAGRLSGRSGEVYNSLGLAALLIAVFWPACLLGLSFQLSFAATVALVGLSRPIAQLFPASWRQEEHWAGRCLVVPLTTTLAAQAGTAPLMAYYFQQFSPISLVANLVVVPLLGLATGLGMLSALTGWWLPWAATAFNGANYLVLELAIALVDAFAGVPLASVRTPRPGPLFLAWTALFLVALARWYAGRRGGKVLIFLLLLGGNLAAWGQVLRDLRLEVTFLDVGQGDATFLRFPNGRTMLVDGGDRSPQFDCGARVLLPFLRWEGAGRVDVVVATHPHDDHIGGLVSILENVEVGHFLDSGQAGDSWAAARLQELVAAKGIRYHRVAAGDSLVGLGGVGGVVLHPGSGWVNPEGKAPYGLNNASVVLELHYGDERLLLAGDLEQQADQAVLGWGGRLRAAVLKVPHHGSATSTQPAFAEAVRPHFALVSVGEGNRFGHPDPAVLDRLSRGGAQIYRTDQGGALLLRTDGRHTELWQMVTAQR